MQAWYRADIITALADGDPVASWVDSTANARTLAQGTADYRPAYKVSIQNGRPAIRFDGSNDMLTGAFAGSVQFTVFSVQRPDALIGDRTVYVAGAYNMAVEFISTTIYNTFTDPGYHTYASAHVTSTVAPELWGFRYDQANFTLWINGAAFPPLVYAGSPTIATSVAVGDFWSGFRPFDGDIFELAFFAVALSDRDRQRVERYLARKWGL
jgi:hypothetical protein